MSATELLMAGGVIELEPDEDIFATHDVPAGGQGVGLKPPAASRHLPAEFWSARPEFTHIRQAANARLVAPEALLGCLLARLTLYVHHGVMLPALIGGRASLNMVVSPVAPTGNGKSAGNRVSRELLPPLPDNVAIFPLGSGEGIAEAYMGSVKEEDPQNPGKQITVRRQVRDAVLFTQDEGGATLAAARRTGTTIFEAIRRAAFGEEIGAKNASEERSRVVPADSYRASMVICFQPEIATDLLSDAAGGTPQRFIFVAADDPDMPTERISWPGPLAWRLPTPLPREIGVPSSVETEIRAAHIAKCRGDEVVDQLDSHRNLNRLKVAALLAILNGRTQIDDEDWRLAGMVIDASNSVRDTIVWAARHRAAQAEEASTSKAVRRAAAVSEDEASRALDSMAKSIANHVHKFAAGGCPRNDGSGCPRACATTGVASKHRKLASIEDAVAEAERLGWISLDGTTMTPGNERP